MTQQQLLEHYEQVLSHYEACSFDQNKLSDTWTHTLERKGRVYSMDDMIRMRTPGSKVTSWISDSSYLVDSSIIDSQNPITARLLDLGESDFGCPSKNVMVNGKAYSGQFLKMVSITSHVIQVLEAAGNTEPRVIEIGGGVGVIPYLLRRYYGDRITLFASDIPESLMIQEWYLRNSLPDVQFTYAPVAGTVPPINGGINFINSHVLQDHHLPFDFAININSMQEMNGETAQAYIRYIERNIAEDGIFFFQNHHGHSATSVPEPSEYEMDNNWSVDAAQLTGQLENCSESEMARFVFRRTTTPEPAETRKLVLRLVWNGLISGLLQNGGVVQALIRTSATESQTDLINQLGEVLRKHDVPIDPVAIAGLQHNLYFPDGTYIQSSLAQSNLAYNQDSTTKLMGATIRAQVELTGLMYNLASDSGSKVDDRVQKQVDDICGELIGAAQMPLHSEYWAAYFCSILFPLGQGNQASRMLVESGAGSSQSPWLLRYAHLLANYGYFDETAELLEKTKNMADIQDDVFLGLKYAQLKHLCGNVEDARQHVKNLFDSCSTDSAAIAVLGKTAAEIDAQDVVKDVCALLSRQSQVASYLSLLDVASAASNNMPKEDIFNLVRPLTNSPDLFQESQAIATRYGVLMLKLGLADIGLPLVNKAMESYRGSYFDLGWLGNTLQNAGFNDLADTCFSKSMALRPDNFMHHDFVGDAYLSANRINDASKHFDTAVRLKPNLRHLRGKAAYCGLTRQIRESKVFGEPRELAMVFQRRQDFYHIGPAWK